MWIPSKLSTKQVTPNQESARVDVTEVYADELLLFNAAEHVVFENYSTQLILCDGCFCLGCHYGDIVVLRRLGDRILFIPDFEGMREDPDHMYRQPPNFIEEKGPLLMNRELFLELALILDSLPDFNSIPSLRSDEIVFLIQLSAPYGVLGNFGDTPKLNRDLITAVSEGDVDHIRDEVDKLCDVFLKHQSSVKLVDVTDKNSVYLYVDGPEFIDWQPIVQDSKGRIVLEVPGLGTLDLNEGNN